MINAHGGQLVDRVLTGDALQAAINRAADLPKLTIDRDLARDVQNIARGVFSPIEGFLGEDDFRSVIETNRLTNGAAWTIPILCDVADPAALGDADEIALVSEDGEGDPLAILTLDEIYAWDKEEAAQAVFGTTDLKHPGVAGFQARKDYLVAGKIDLIDNDRGPYADFNLYPAETREVFEQRGWKSIVAFQTRNVPHAGHEDLQKTVLGLCDGLLIHPIIGKKKPGDFRDDVILQAYRVLIDKYFAADRVFLNILPTEMRYAGPKEAIMHAIMRKNYGCTHIVIGRDHAGVGKFYGEEEAIEIFENFPDLEIKPIMIRGDFWYCKTCARVASNRTCPHGEESQISFSGTMIRKMVEEGTAPPAEIMRPEVFEVIKQFENPFV